MLVLLKGMLNMPRGRLRGTAAGQDSKGVQGLGQASNVVGDV
jgi:hypothetical protein